MSSQDSTVGQRSSKRVLRQENDCFLLSEREDVAGAWFDARNPALRAQTVGQAGRGAAWFVECGGVRAVLRQFRRGGLVARLTQSLYVWQGLARTRSFREFEVLAYLRQHNVRVAQPLAAQSCRVGFFFYQAALLTHRIEGAKSLSEFEDPAVWRRAGQAVRRMHAQQVWHADLNVHNILVDAHSAIWLIDFDRAQMRVCDTKRLQGNLQRLERSVRKVCPHLHASCWTMLRAGYDRSEDCAQGHGSE